jgi:hypothetical protein
MAAAFAGRHPEHCHSFWSVVAMPTALRDEDRVTRAQATSCRTLRFEHGDSVSPTRTWSSSSALCSSQGGRPEKLVTRTCSRGIECADRAWRFFARIGRSARTIRFTACGLKSWTIPSGSSSAEGGTCLSIKSPWREKSYAHRVPKTLRVHELSFAVRPGENDHKPVGITNPGSGPNIKR